MTSQDEITRTADRLRDALGAAAELMTTGASAARVRKPRISHPWTWLLPTSAAASVAAVALAAVFAGNSTSNVSAPFPQVFGGIGQTGHLVNIPAPDPAVLTSPGAVAARSRVVKIEGVAPSCDRVIQGSGFVYAPQHVITDAHVVAGVTRPAGMSGHGPEVTTAAGQRLASRVVFYDPRIDIAVLDVPGLNVAPLRFSTQADPGDDAVVAGYPDDHSYIAVAARIGQVLRAQEPDIYQHGTVHRQIYRIRALVQRGSSGGPLLSAGGTVDGVVFAAAAGAGSADTGFVLTTAEIRADATAGATATVPVSTRGCT